MNTRMFILSLIATVFAMSAFAQSNDGVLMDKITSAVMKVYDEELAKDPNNYNVLFARWPTCAWPRNCSPSHCLVPI